MNKPYIAGTSIPIPASEKPPKPGMTLFYIRETQVRQRWWSATNFKTIFSRNIPIMGIWAYNLEQAEKLAAATINLRINKRESQGFYLADNGKWYKTQESRRDTLVNVFNIFVSYGCRRCKSKAYIPGCEHVKWSRCFRCGGSGDEERPINIDTLEALPNPHGLEIGKLPTKVTRAKEAVTC